MGAPKMGLYTQAGRGDNMARFVALILKLARAERVHGVLGLCADFYDDVLAHPGAPRLVEGCQVTVEARRSSGSSRGRPRRWACTSRAGTIIYEQGIQAIARGLFPAKQWPGTRA